MTTKSVRRWLRVSLAAAVVAVGCNHAPVQKTAQGPSPNNPTNSVAASRTTGYRAATPSTPSTQTAVAAAPKGPLAPPAETKPVAPPTPAPEVPVVSTILDRAVHQTAATAPEKAAPSREEPSSSSRRTAFSHADDYSWLSGQLQYSRFNKTWRLRFASLDEIDPYGGSVTIVDDLRLAGCKDGQMVRVDGHLLNPGQKGSAPPYEVNSIQVLDKQD